jgi:glycosyltransferase involved in cell wall biosynthesis
VRILILSWKDLAHPRAGGAEVFTEEVARALVSKGHEVTLLASSVAGCPEEEVVCGVRVVRRGSRFSVYRSARRFWREQPRGRFDVVIDEINTRPFSTPRWIDDTPIVALIYQLAREIWSYEAPFPVSILGRYVLEPWWLRAYRRIPAMTISQSSADSLARYHAWTNVTLLPIGLEDQHVPDVPKEPEPTIVFLGRLVSMKRPEDVIDAFRIVARTFPSAQCWMIGDGPMLSRLRSTAPRGVSLFGRVAQEEVVERLARAHVLVAASVREGWGLNVSEAAACGTPSIGYAVPGLVDSLRASGGAVVVPRPEALGAALVDFFSGRLGLSPRISTVSWPEVALSVERRLQLVLEAANRSDAPSSPRDRMPAG